jgi:hypothetical protein
VASGAEGSKPAGRCPVNVNRPNVSQLDRDVIEDLGLTELDDRTCDLQALHAEEPMPS